MSFSSVSPVPMSFDNPLSNDSPSKQDPQNHKVWQGFSTCPESSVNLIPEQPDGSSAGVRRRLSERMAAIFSGVTDIQKNTLKAWAEEVTGVEKATRGVVAKKIENCIQKKQRVLNISGYGLTSLPSVVSQLT